MGSPLHFSKALDITGVWKGQMLLLPCPGGRSHKRLALQVMVKPVPCSYVWVKRRLNPPLVSAATLDRLPELSDLSFLLCEMEIIAPTSEGDWTVQ